MEAVEAMETQPPDIILNDVSDDNGGNISSIDGDGSLDSLDSLDSGDTAFPGTATAAEIEEADFQAVANPGTVIIMPVSSSRGDVIEHISRTIPSNEYGLPTYYIRSDLFDVNLAAYTGRVTQEEADQAVEVLYYQDGYPTFKNGSPFWTQMPHEVHTDYVLFQRFLELDELEGIRLLDSLARRENVELTRLRTIFQEFYWSARARAYDLFVVAAEAKKRQVLTRKSENAHYETAGTILGKIVERINNEDDLIEKMDSKELFDLFEKMVKVQRLSLGLTGQNASSTPQEFNSPGQSVELILRNLTKNSGLTDQASDSIQDRLAVLMSDENMALTAQELIIRANTNNLVPTK